MSVVAIPRTTWRRRARLRLIGWRIIPREIPFLVGAILIVSALVLGIVSLQAVLSETSFKMRELSKRTTQLQAEHSRLKLLVAELSSPDRIAREARTLGLTIPTQVRTLSVELPRGVDRSRTTSLLPGGTSGDSREQP